MPKIRIKNIGSETKSGILSSADKKFKKQNFVDYKQENFNSINPEITFRSFNDNKTVNYIESYNDTTLPRFVDNRNYISTPSTHDDKLVNRIPSKTQDNYEIGEIKDEFWKNNSYKETSISRSEIENKQEIKIDLTLPGEEGYFQFAKNTDVQSYVSVGGESIETRNANMAYWNFVSNRWVYLGDINKNYFNVGSDMLDAPIGFTGLTVTNENQGLAIDSLGGDPTTSFGFPFDVKFQPLDNCKLEMKSYIVKDFVLKKVAVSFDLEYLSSDADYSQLQYLNFFILNNREFESEAIPDKTYDDASIFLVNANPKNESEVSAYSFIRDWSIIDETGDIRKFSVYDNKTNQVLTESFPAELSETRDLICYSKSLIVNASAINPGSFSHNYLNAVVDSDSQFGTSAGANKVSGKLEFVFVPSINTTYKDRYDKMSYAGIYPTCYNHGRGYLNRQTSRSKNLGAEHIPFNEESRESNEFYREVYKPKETRRHAEYVIKPSDKITIGVSFTPNMSLEGNCGTDVLKILGGINVTLYGSYESNNNSFVKTNVIDIHDNIKRDLKFNGDNSDDLNESLIHSKSLYFNRRIGATINTGSSSIKIYGQKETGEFGSSINCNESLYLLDTIDEGLKNKVFWQTNRFGNFADFIKTSPWHVENEKNPKYNVYRRWFAGFKLFTPSPNSKSWNIDSYSRVTDGSFKE